jgi:hypothetical protein
LRPPSDGNTPTAGWTGLGGVAGDAGGPERFPHGLTRGGSASTRQGAAPFAALGPKQEAVEDCENSGQQGHPSRGAQGAVEAAGESKESVPTQIGLNPQWRRALLAPAPRQRRICRNASEISIGVGPLGSVEFGFSYAARGWGRCAAQYQRPSWPFLTNTP